MGNFIVIWLLFILAFARFPGLPLLFAALSPLAALPLWVAYRWLINRKRKA